MPFDQDIPHLAKTQCWGDAQSEKHLACKHEDLNCIHKKVGRSAMHLKSQHWGGKTRSILGNHWLDSLAEIRKFQFKDSVSKNMVESNMGRHLTASTSPHKCLSHLYTSVQELHIHICVCVCTHTSKEDIKKEQNNEQGMVEHAHNPGSQ